MFSDMILRGPAKILASGVEDWNAWKQEHRDLWTFVEEVELRGTDLRGADFWRVVFSDGVFTGGDLRSVMLRWARFHRCDLSGASLVDAVLDHTVFRDRVLLCDADFSKTSVSNVQFQNCDLRRANFRQTSFSSSSFEDCDISDATFEGAKFYYTQFIGIDLSSALGLADTKHSGPSSLDIETLRLSRGRLPHTFAKGCGLTDTEIATTQLWDPDLTQETLTDLLYAIDRARGSQPIQRHAVFISYSHADAEFVDRLQEALDAAGIRHWRDVHNMLAGRIEEQIDKALHLNQIAIIVLSKASMNSDWVQWEVSRARERERATTRNVLCPVAIDDAWTTSDWPGPLRQQLLKYYILDFSDWRVPQQFQAMMKRLTAGLDLYYST